MDGVVVGVTHRRDAMIFFPLSAFISAQHLFIFLSYTSTSYAVTSLSSFCFHFCATSLHLPLLHLHILISHFTFPFLFEHLNHSRDNSQINSTINLSYTILVFHFILFTSSFFLPLPPLIFSLMDNL